MFNTKSHLGKKGNITHIMSFALVFSLISIIYIFISLITWSASNDYLFFTLQNISEELEEDGIVSAGTSTLTQSYGDDYTNFNLHLDDLWFIAYLVLVISSVIVSYKADRQNYYSFLGLLFYGVMFFLFILTIFGTLTTWFKDNLLTQILPNAYILVPKFYFYLDHIGIFSAIHFVVCLLANMLDFDFASINRKKKLEDAAFNDEEIV